MRLLTLTSFVALIPAMSMADESVSFEVMLGHGAMICDYAESVVTSLERGVLMPDCGIFQTRTGAPATVTIIGEYQGVERTHPLAMFEFHQPTPWGNQVQYGWWAGDMPTQASADIEA